MFGDRPRAQRVPTASTRPPSVRDVVAPERNLRSGRLGRVDRADKERQANDRTIRRRPRLGSAKYLVPAAAAVAGALIAGGVLLAGRGGGAAGEATPGVGSVETTVNSPSTVATTTPPPTTSLVPTTALVVSACVVSPTAGETTVRPDAAAAPAPAAPRSDAAPGAIVETASGARAELLTDGDALTRLDADSSSTCAAAGRIEITSGRTWSRTRSGPLTLSVADYTVDVAPDSAVAISCRAAPACSIAVVQGSALLSSSRQGVSLDAPQSIVLDSDPAVELQSRSIVPFDSAFGDEWMTENAALDAAQGLAGAADLYAQHGPAFASLAGTFVGQRTVLEVGCLDGPCSPGFTVGNVAERTYTFDIDCAASLCVGTAIIEYVLAGAAQTATVPMAFDGSVYRWTLQAPSYQCSFDDNRDGVAETLLGDLQLNIDYTLTPQAAEVRDDRYVVTAISVLAESTNTVTNPHPRCAAFGSSRNTSEFVASR